MSIETGVDAIDIYGMRHGRSEWNELKLLQGQSIVQDKPNGLSEEGRRQVRQSAEGLARQLAGKEVMIWSSPLPRAKETAEIVAEIFNFDKARIQCDDALMEACHGSFEGLTEAEYSTSQHYIDRSVKSKQEKFEIPFGPDSSAESELSVYNRVQSVFKKISEQKDGLVHIVATHGGPIDSMRKKITGDYELPQSQHAQITHFKYILKDDTIQLG
jgi:broad specificity phosphatase PhoE